MIPKQHLRALQAAVTKRLWWHHIYMYMYNAYHNFVSHKVQKIACEVYSLAGLDACISNKKGIN